MKKMYAVSLAAVAGILFISASPSFAAADKQKANYGKVKLGVMQPTGELDDENYDTGGEFDLLYGRYLNRYISVEAGLDVFGNEAEVSGSNRTAGTYNQDNFMTASGLVLTLKAEYPVGPVRLYGGGGIGFYAATLTTEIDSSALGDFDKTESDYVAGAHVVAGLDYDINDMFFVSLEGKYRITDDVEINETVASVPVSYNGDLDGYSVTAGFGVRF